MEIKRLWPAYNSSQKRFEHAYGLYTFEDQNGYLRLAIDKRRKSSSPIYTFNMILDGHALIKKLITEFSLCSKLCFVQRNNDPCSGIVDQTCAGACEQKEDPVQYNQRVCQAIDHLKYILPTFVLLDEGRNQGEQSCILMEHGQFYGMGYVPKDSTVDNIPWLKDQLTPYPANDYIRNLVQNYAIRYPEKLTPVGG